MEIAEWQIDGTITFLYFISVVLLLLLAMFAIIWITFLIKAEIRESYIDLFKIIQFMLAFIHLIRFIANYMCLFWNKSTNLLLKDIIFDACATLLLYYAMILLSWY